MAPEPATVCYVDTSALVKRYVEEAGSDAFDAFCELAGIERVLCPLGMTEFIGVLQRRIRSKSLSRAQASAVHQRFLADVAAGGWRMVEFDTGLFTDAGHLMTDLGVPLSTLDAMHLACALHHRAQELATADSQLATAARKAKLRVRTF